MQPFKMLGVATYSATSYLAIMLPCELYFDQGNYIK